MKKYMVVMYGVEGQFANFFDALDKAEDCRMNAVCGMGWAAEVYERVEDEEGSRYELMYC